MKLPTVSDIDSRLLFALRMADSAVILAQRLCEWCGKCPAPEEDIAISNVALDLLGQARLWYAVASQHDPQHRTEDDFAFLRDTRDYYNVLLVEQSNGSYADTLARQFYFDSWHYLLLEQLTQSEDNSIADTASKALVEVDYHVRRSSDLIIRLANGTPVSKMLIQDGLHRLWAYTGELFIGDDHDEALALYGLIPRPDSLQAPWKRWIAEVFNEAGLPLPAPQTWMQTGGRQGQHGEAHAYLLAEMQCLHRSHPGVRW